MDRHCVVLAGGLGTRLREITGGLIPKVMVPVNGRPFIDYKLRSLELMQVTSATLLVGELGHLVAEHIDESARDRSHVSIDISFDGPQLLGTGGAIRRIVSELPEHFWVTYGDTFVLADLEGAEAECRAAGGRTMVAWRNDNQLQASNVIVEKNKILDYQKLGAGDQFRHIDFGLLRFHRSDFLVLDENKPADLSVVVHNLIQRDLLCAWEVSNRFWDVGTPTALEETSRYLATQSGSDMS